MKKLDMKNKQGIQNRIVVVIGFSFGFILGMQSKNWWALPSAIIASLVISFLFFFFAKLFKIWGIGGKNLDTLTRQQRRNLKRLAQHE